MYIHTLGTHVPREKLTSLKLIFLGRIKNKTLIFLKKGTITY